MKKKLNDKWEKLTDNFLVDLRDIAKLYTGVDISDDKFENMKNNKELRLEIREKLIKEANKSLAELFLGGNDDWNS